MARHGKVLPARRPQERVTEGESVLLRSAETIGRMIGSLQRQIDGAHGRLSKFVANPELVHGDGNGSRRAHNEKRKPAVRAKKTSDKKKTSNNVKRSAKSAQARKATKRTRKSR
jgi:hypothetical protein